MIECKPQGICSWDFVLSEGGQQAVTSVNWAKEEGSIEVAGLYLQVKKHGMLSGRWTLEHDGHVVASASKESALTRSFNVQAADFALKIRAEGVMTRTMLVEIDNKIVARISPLHPFTRRAAIRTYSEICDFATYVFVFWLVTVVWKRNAGGHSN